MFRGKTSDDLRYFYEAIYSYVYMYMVKLFL